MWARQIRDNVKNKLRYYDCMCDCGNKTTVQKQALLSGHIQSCGCAKFNNPKVINDLTGKKFGRLTVMKRDIKRDYNDKINNKKVIIHWLCECECGSKNVSVTGYQLRSGHTQSCGCYASEMIAKRNQKYSTKVNYSEFLNDNTVKLFNDNRDDFLLVDLCDYDYIKGWFWKKDKKGYWNTNAKLSDNKGKSTLRVHQEIAIRKYGVYDTKKLFPDHLSRNKSDNTRKNLILKTNAENMKNRDLSMANTSGKTGVSWSSSKNKYMAYITVDYKTINLGSFSDYGDAVEARLLAENKYGFTCDNVFPVQDLV